MNRSATGVQITVGVTIAVAAALAVDVIDRGAQPHGGAGAVAINALAQVTAWLEAHRTLLTIVAFMPLGVQLVWKAAVLIHERRPPFAGEELYYGAPEKGAWVTFVAHWTVAGGTFVASALLEWAWLALAAVVVAAIGMWKFVAQLRTVLG